MIKFKSFYESEELNYHIKNNIPIGELYRVGSEKYYSIFREVRYLQHANKVEITGLDKHLVENTDIGEFALYNEENVPLDSPMLEAMYDGEEVDLNSPKRGGSAKFYVYVKNPKTDKVNKVTFGDTTGLKVKLDNDKARASFVARHQCETKTDKTKAGYWSCNLPRYAKQLGLSGGGNFFW